MNCQDQLKGIFRERILFARAIHLGEELQCCSLRRKDGIFPLCASIIARLNKVDSQVSVATSEGGIDDLFDHFKIILELLKKEQLYAKFSKCDFWLESVQFLGHVINNKGVHVDPAKVEAIRNWSAPTTPTEKNKKYEWGTEEDEAFQTLKQKLCSAPILALPEGTENFVVYCDASHKGYGAVLMQREKGQDVQDLKKLYWWPTLKALRSPPMSVNVDLCRLPERQVVMDSIWVIDD
ncbi:putative reverse transcriptase domain-containing protein [Tanacetum coccineum]